MATTKQVRCKFHRQGACTKGSSCPFSHDKSVKADNVCKFFLSGTCSYGSRCRYDHVRPKKPVASKTQQPMAQRSQPAARASAWSAARPASTAHASTQPLVNTAVAAKGGDGGHLAQPSSGCVVLQKSTWKRSARQQHVQPEWASAADFVPAAAVAAAAPPRALSVSFSAAAATGVEEQESSVVVGDADGNLSADASRTLLCPFAAARGECAVENCPYTHGEQCPCCQRCVLHPDRPEEHHLHIDACVADVERHIEHEHAVQRSEGVECCVCMDVVLEKSNRSERRFGILQNCNHAFCLGCIRDWRSTAVMGQTVRACPMCRTPSHFVVPSETFVTDPVEKDKLIETYKKRMGAIDCKHFNFGEGRCPFGTSCFYAHRLPDGSADQPEVRFRADADGAVLPHTTSVRLWDFFAQREQQDQQ
eukprot:m.13749 g.13749  ORF g.13749 m.13749 type:complete len:421 (-) comp4649_c0_seq1:488-1750(-)